MWIWSTFMLFTSIVHILFFMHRCGIFIDIKLRMNSNSLGWVQFFCENSYLLQLLLTININCCLRFKLVVSAHFSISIIVTGKFLVIVCVSAAPLFSYSFSRIRSSANIFHFHSIDSNYSSSVPYCCFPIHIVNRIYINAWSLVG